MPTILRFRGFNFVIYTFDHPPAHVHAKGSGGELILTLNCPGGPVSVRNNFGVRASDEADLLDFATANRDILCEAWEALHGVR